MKNRDNWKPTKFVYKKGWLIASRDPGEVSISSRLVSDITAANYNRYLSIYAHGKLLDLGCGKVPLFEAYRDYVDDNICVDWENSLHKNPFLDRHCDLTLDLPFEEDQFDTVILSDVLEHIPEPLRLMNEISRILSPGGVLMMNVPFYYRLHEAPHDYYRYTEYALRRFIALSGLELEKLIPAGGTPEILADILAKNLNPIPLIGPPCSMFIQWLISVFVKTKIGNKISLRTSRIFPLGYFLIAKKP
jgi:SAM-dependent methyltransferase